MKNPLFPILVISALSGVVFLATGAQKTAQPSEPVPAAEYNIYSGNTHSHTSNTWSHGAHWAKRTDGVKPMKVINGVSHAAKDNPLKPNWKDVQGPPSVHLALAKANGFDFYAITDHSQEACFHPTKADNPAWVAQKRDVLAATNAKFVGISAFEHSENNGPDGKGHYNVFNSAEYLNALEEGVDIKYFYKWLPTAKPNGDGPVVASFNHPGPGAYNNFAYRTPEVTEIIAMYEVLGGSQFNPGRYKGYITALDKGWKVAPVSPLDNHGTEAIKSTKGRAFVLATAKTKAAILEAMKARRVYGALYPTIQCRYTVNGKVMGSTLDKPNKFQFDIYINDTATGNPGRKITRIDIVTDGGKVVKTHEPKPAHTVRWKPEISDSTSKYYFVRVWSAGGADGQGASQEGNEDELDEENAGAKAKGAKAGKGKAAKNGKGGKGKGADPQDPVALLAPVWTGR